MANATHNDHQTNGRVTIDDEPENPLQHRTPEQIGREFDELRQQVKDSLGNRDARYIRSIIALQRRLALLGGVELIASRWRIPWILGASTLGLAKILENMEIGHNVLHGQWDWMNDPVINSRAWDWDTASTAEAWRHSHNYIHHTFTNIIGQDRDLGYEIMRIDPHQGWHPVYLLRPFYNILLMMLFEWGVAVHDLNLGAIRKGDKDPKQLRKELMGIAGKARTQIQKDYVAWPLVSGIVMTLAELASFSARGQGSEKPRGGILSQLVKRRSFREPFMRTLTADIAANVIRNVWSSAIIFCGALPGPDLHVHSGGDRGREPRRLVRAPADRCGHHRRRPAVPRDQRQPRLPGRAPPLPGHAQHALRRDRAQGARDLPALRAAVQLGAVPQAARDGAAHDRAPRVPGRPGAPQARRLRRPADPRQGRAPGARDGALELGR